MPSGNEIAGQTQVIFGAATIRVGSGQTRMEENNAVLPAGVCGVGA